MCVASLDSHLAGPFKLSMSNHKLNKLVLTKRPARFLPDEHQFRKDFGGVSKKPKLDVRLSQSAVSNVSNTLVTNDHFGSVQKRNKLDVRLSQTNSSSLSVTNVPVPSTSDATLDDLWGEELSAEAVEECLFLASQVCPEVNIVDNAASNNQRDLQHSYQGKNGNVSGMSTSPSDGHFKIPISSARHSNLKVKQPTNSILFPSRDAIRTSVPVNQTTNSPNLKKSSSSSSHPYLPNASVIGSTNPVVNGVHTVSNESGALAEEIQKLKLENKDLKDKSLSREGEVSILRQQLKQLQMQLESQRIENISKLEEQAQKFKDQLNERKKELEITNTQLQFKIMEATTMRNHCKLLESNSKLKLVEPQRSTTSDSVKAKGDCFSESILPSDISPPKIHSASSSRIRGQTSTPTKRILQKVQATDSSLETQRNCSVPKNDELKPARPREGSMLGVAVNEFLFRKSVPDVSWILHIRKKQSLCRRIKEADDINSTILSLQQNDRTLESCYTAVNRLIAMDSLSSPMAWPYVEKVVEDCQEIVCRQVHILRLLLQVQSKTERVLLSEEIASVIGTLAVKKDRRLMSAKPWYRDEEGVESRRALGLLSVLCDVSHLAADLITGTIQPSTKGEIAEKVNITKTAGESLSSYSKRLLLENPSKESYHNNQEAGPSNVEMESSRDADTSVMEIEFVSPEYSDTQNSTKPFVLKGFGEGYCEYTHRPFGFLRLLRDLASSISIQRRTRHFIGVLTGMMAVLKAVVCKSTLMDDGLKLMSQIIQEVVFACPQVEVIVAVFELLRVLTPYTEIMNTLCHNCESSALVDKRYINLTYFSRGSCVTQVLFRLLPKGETSMSLRTNLCSHMMHWLYNMVCIPSKETSWLLVLQDDATRTCHCKHKLTQGLVITLYNSVCDFEHILTKGSKLEWELRHILVMGVMVLRNLLQREFGLYFECAEEEYQLLISKIQIVSEKLELNSMQRECLTDLLNIEEKNDEEKTEIQEPFDIYWNESANQCRVLLSSRAPSRKQPPKKPRRSIAQINKAWNIAV